MKHSKSGDIIENTNDDLGKSLRDVDADIHAVIRESDTHTGKFYFIILTDEDDQIASSEAIFDNASDAHIYVKKWVSDIHMP